MPDSDITDRILLGVLKGFSLTDGLIVIIIGFGGLASVFDILRKTVFVNADWNYNYPYWKFVYNFPILIVLIFVLAFVIITAPKWLDLSPNRFASALFFTCVLVFTLALFSLPLELTRALDVDKRGLFNGGVYLVKNGPIDFLSNFNTLPQTAPANEDLYIWPFDISQEDEAANAFALWISEVNWLPFNETMGEYVGDYTTQKHGPVSVLLIVPFMYLLGTTTKAALTGSIVIACLIPVVGYYIFRLYFDETLSKIGAVLLGITPGLFIWSRHASPIPYDIVTALLVAVSLYTFLRGIRVERRLYFLLTGCLVALAIMTKLTGMVILLPMTLILYWESECVMLFLRRAGLIVVAWVTMILVFLLAGYNAIAQLLYTTYKLTLFKIHKTGAGGRPSGSPADALNNDLIGLFGTLYNLRWMNLVLLILAAAFVSYALYDRHLIKEKDHFKSTALLTAFIPFGIWVIFSSGTLSRHTIILIVPLGFIGLSGLNLIAERGSGSTKHDLVRFYQISLLICAAQFLINI